MRAAGNTGREPAGRRLYLVDIENMVGNRDGRVSRDEVDRMRQAVMAHMPVGEGDQVVIGTGHSDNLLNASVWRHVRHVFRRGHNGADLALLDVADREDIAARFSGVVLCSGDGIFADAMRRLRAQGCQVSILTGIGLISSALYHAADTVLRLAMPASATFQATA